MDTLRLYQILSIFPGFYFWTLLGQGVLFLFTGRHSQQNFIYQLFLKINWPVTWLARRITPEFIVDRHIGFIAFALVVVVRLGLYILFFTQGWLPNFSTPAN